MSEDCRECALWERCPCGKEGHENGTSVGYSIGECKMYDPIEIARQYAPKFDKPVVDMVEVVRCKDCKYFKTYPLGETDCAYISEKAWAQGELNFDPDDFCSRGERKVEE